MAGLLVAAGFLILLQQLFDVASAADFLTPLGRYSTVRLLATRMPALLAADICFVLAALYATSRRGIRVLGLLHFLVAAGAVVVAAVFLQGAGEQAGSVPLQQLSSFRITVSRVLVGAVVVAGGCLLAGIALWKQNLKIA